MGEAKKSAKQGRNKFKCDAYTKSGRQEMTKLAHILRSNGPAQALRYASQYGLYAHLRRIGRRVPGVFKRAMEKNAEFAHFIRSGS